MEHIDSESMSSPMGIGGLQRQNVFERGIFYLLVLLTIFTLYRQTVSLAVFPIANATRWYSDESWVMEEAISQIQHGVVTYPHARASTLQYSKGLLLGTTWLSAVLYGIPAVLAPLGSDIVFIGRIVSLVLSILTLCFLYYFLRRLGSPPILGALAMLVVATTRANFIASHCARPDILAGLIVLLVIGYFSIQRSKGFVPSSSRWWFSFGVTIMALAWTSSVHLLTLLGPLALWIMFAFSAFKKPSYYLSAVLGAISLAAILAIVYFLTTSGITFLGSTSHGLQFDFIIQETPILRPFSRSVQLANLVIRLKLFASEAPGVLVLAGLDIILLIWLKIKHRGIELFSATERFVFSSTAVVMLSWLYLQIASETYTAHILSVLVFAMCLLLARLLPRIATGKMLAPIAALCGLALGYIGMRDAATAAVSGGLLSGNNRIAMVSIVQEIKADARAHGISKPLVVVETPALHEIQTDTGLEVMTDHFSGFRTSNAPLLDILKNQHVDYAVLYNSNRYPKNRYQLDEFFQTVTRSSDLIAKRSSPLFDMGISYFDSGDRAMDTLLLYRLRR
jgi:hypothetical protein